VQYHKRGKTEKRAKIKPKYTVVIWGWGGVDALASPGGEQEEEEGLYFLA
jgi:hypothetical protein